ncbi:TPA: capsid protein [Streptococcus suis]
MDMIRNGLKSFLQIEAAQPQMITITEALTFESNALKNKIWYRGDSFELKQLYEQLPNADLLFWGAKSSQGMEIRKLHTGIPGLIVDRLADITMADLNDLEFTNPQHEALWKEIDMDNAFNKQLEKAIKESLVVGDGAFRISFDKEVSQLPIVEWVSGDRVDIVYNRGRLKEVVFKTPFTERNKHYMLLETYGYGYIKTELYEGRTLRALGSTDYAKDLKDYEFDKAVMLCVPFAIFSSNKWEGRGQSIFDRKADSFDSLDEAWSQWMDALRAGRTKQYIPDCFIPRDPNTGAIMKPNSFDNRFIRTDADMREGAKNQIELQQAAIPHDSYLATYVTALDLALQGLISPSTLGIDVKKLDNAEAQREKEKATLYTRNAIVTALEEFLPRLIGMIINSQNVAMKSPIEEVDVTVPFGEYANPSFESQVETVSKAKTGGIMSIEASVEELYGDSKDEDWKAEEVARLKAEQGFAEAEEPVLNQSLDNFKVEEEDDSENSDDRSEDLPDVEKGSGGTAKDSE